MSRFQNVLHQTFYFLRAVKIVPKHDFDGPGVRVCDIFLIPFAIVDGEANM